jgi:tryptophan synthase beta chain
MGAIDIKRQAPNVARMKMLGASVVSAESGSKTLKDATNEAIRDWINNPLTTHYIIGSVVGPHPYPDMVAKFQSIVSKEIKSQLFEKEGTENPDYLIANIGGGSNAAGLYYEYLENENVKIISVEAAGEGVKSGKSAATSVLGKSWNYSWKQNLINAKLMMDKLLSPTLFQQVLIILALVHFMHIFLNLKELNLFQLQMKMP